MPNHFSPSERDIARFEPKFIKLGPDDCWPWIAASNSKGHGRFWIAGETVQAHQAAYRIFVGVVPDNHDVHHTCKNTRCVNPAHLECVPHNEHPFLDETIPLRKSLVTHCPFSERDIARFYSKFVKGESEECWTWTAGRNPQGYGMFSMMSKNWPAHRIAYCLFVGAIPDEHDIHHHCKNKRCVNPAHLECMHSDEHMRLHDTPGSLNRQRTHCPKGHPYDLLNTRYYNGKRYCRACRRLRYYACEKAQRKPWRKARKSLAS